LLEGKEPIDEHSSEPALPVTFIKNRLDMEVLLEDAIVTQKFSPVSTVPVNNFCPADLLVWAKSKGYEVTEEFNYLLPKGCQGGK